MTVLKRSNPEIAYMKPITNPLIKAIDLKHTIYKPY